ncbi:MAG: M23 family metallopeptidase [Acidimicrobiia bacterium]|jgi:murein DD-endopeptidase MepM/ murein hydrolase activator NlpD
MSVFSPFSSRALVVASAASVAALGFASRVDAHATEQDVAALPSATALVACPVGGFSVFVDSWGDPRSGGRRHEGVDMEAERGTPVVAVRSGTAEFKRSRLGGNSVWLVTPAGERFYYAHLDAWEGDSRAVVAGEVIGYVGQSGNAAGDHLHFEVRLGDRAINPYPLVQSACSDDLDDRRHAVIVAPPPTLAAR